MEEEKVNMEEEKMYSKQEVEAIVAQVNMQARSQCEAYARRCMAAEEQLSYKRLDYLFKVVEYAGSFDMDFVKKCVEEIQESITIPEEQEPESETEKVEE